MTTKRNKSSLSVKKGIEKPNPVNINLNIKRRKLLSVEDYVDGIPDILCRELCRWYDYDAIMIRCEDVRV